MLGIETATQFGGVAVVSGCGDLHGEITLRSHESHSERILPAVEALLRALGATLRDLAAVAVSCGPGSFTGLRAGIAAAKGLAFSLEVPLFGVPTLEALAANSPPGEDPVCAVINARRGEVFRAFFRSGPAGLERRGPDNLVRTAALIDELPARCLVIGELPIRGSEIPPPAAGVRLAPAHLNYPRAAVIAWFGSIAHGESRPSELASLMPRYLRPCDAEHGRRSA